MRIHVAANSHLKVYYISYYRNLLFRCFLMLSTPLAPNQISKLVTPTLANLSNLLFQHLHINHFMFSNHRHDGRSGDNFPDRKSAGPIHDFHDGSLYGKVRWCLAHPGRYPNYMPEYIAKMQELVTTTGNEISNAQIDEVMGRVHAERKERPDSARGSNDGGSSQIHSLGGSTVEDSLSGRTSSHEYRAGSSSSNIGGSASGLRRTMGGGTGFGGF
jgi:hypothetical protein